MTMANRRANPCLFKSYDRPQEWPAAVPGIVVGFAARYLSGLTKGRRVG